ncbi:hypothetical protein BDV36DRAFT_251901 [Aspergillus pseudocaelatus]|uniref:Uncharacterized protein n=1 Tax=Aspergillus pseudocaelatus TaxID=1825620 RepID=A0ABQ6WQN0_9EURO|nr:hypothetical protein BDV36DRAFT_251901 [Aspergillus pseudocaelatus]
MEKASLASLTRWAIIHTPPLLVVTGTMTSPIAISGQLHDRLLSPSPRQSRHRLLLQVGDLEYYPSDRKPSLPSLEGSPLSSPFIRVWGLDQGLTYNRQD